MTKHTFTNGSRSVITNEQNGFFFSRVWLNYGETAGYTNANHTTFKGAERWAKKQLAN